MALQKLGIDTIQLVSSAQVITSVHSVVKELVENSLDAKASSVDVRLENYGLDLIQVRDNGSGIKKADVSLMAIPHYTSKLSSFQDLSSLTSYGFRGEALSAIANVAELSITTATKDDKIAFTYTIAHNGKVVDTKPSSLGVGTTVAVSNLFRKFPVRKKVYRSTKKCGEELKRVEQLLLAFGLAFPGVRFSLRHNKVKLWDKEQTSGIKSNVSLIFGPVVSQHLMPVNYQCFDPMIKLQAFVPKSTADLSLVARSRPDRLFILVNNRPVEIKVIARIVRDSFIEAFPNQAGHFPIALVMVSVLPEDVDINLEPNKTTVLLHNIDLITSTLSSLLTQVYSPCKVHSSESEEKNPPQRSTKQVEREAVEADPSVRLDRECTQENTKPVNETSPPIPTTSQQPPYSDTPSQDLTKTAEAPNDLSVSLDRTKYSTVDSLYYNDNDISLLDISELEKGFSSSSEEESTVETSREATSQDGEASSETKHTTGDNQVSLLSWSRGSGITDNTNNPVEPVKILSSSDARTGESTKTLTQSKLCSRDDGGAADLVLSHPLKRVADKTFEGQRPAKKHKDSSSVSLDKFLNRAEDQAKGTDNPASEVSFNIEKVTNRNRHFCNRKVYLRPRDNVVGSCQFLHQENIWIVVLNNTLGRFNINGLEDPCTHLTKTQVEHLFTRTLQDTISRDSFFHQVYEL